MSDIVKSKIHEMNVESLEVISTEAMSNPLKSMTGAIKNRLHKIVGSLSVNKQNKLEPVDSNRDNYSNFQVAHKENNGRYQKTVSYSTIKNVLVTVPVGFTGDLVGYTNTLININQVMSNLSKDVIEPTHNLILKYIGKPDTMSNISNMDFNKIKLHSSEIEKFKKEMNKYFSAKNKNQTLPVGKLIKNLNQFSPLATQVSEHIIPFQMDNDKRKNNIYKSYTDLQKSLDLLLVRIEQKPEQYQLNKLNAERLANLINDVAVEIELYSALVSYSDQLTICVINLQDKILQAGKQ